MIVHVQDEDAEDAECACYNCRRRRISLAWYWGMMWQVWGTDRSEVLALVMLEVGVMS